MEIAIDDSGGVRLVTLAGELTIYVAASVKDQIIAPLADAGEIEINLADIREIDTAGVQILMLAKREAQRLGKKLRLTAHSSAVTDFLELYGLTAWFGDPLLLSANEPQSASFGGRS